jgi:branched-chain amino acid transport system ATP-binding protein
MKALLVDDISKNFGGVQALTKVYLEIEEGERRVIIGPNGAGKTTLFRVISGIVPPTSGEVYLFGERVTRSPVHHRAGMELSQTFQLIDLFKRLTVLENIVLALRSFQRLKYTLHWPLSSYKQVIHQAEQFLTEWGFWDKRNIKVSSLSYGDQRLLDIMLALVSEPRILLVDEPSSGLSAAEIKAVASRIRDLSKEITILFIEHNMDVALDLAHKVTVLHMGQVVTEGTPAEIKRDPQVQEIYLGTEKEL